jgi:hypothetical protein
MTAIDPSCVKTQFRFIFGVSKPYPTSNKSIVERSGGSIFSRSILLYVFTQPGPKAAFWLIAKQTLSVSEHFVLGFNGMKI